MSHGPAPTPVRRKQRILLKAEAFSRKHYRLVFLLALVAVVVASILTSRLKLQSDILELMPRGIRSVEAFRESVRDFGSFDYLLVLLEGDEQTGPEDLEPFADLLAERLLTLPDLVQSVEYRLEPDERLLDIFSRNALLFTPPEAIPSLAGRFTDEAIRGQIGANREALSSPASVLSGEIIATDPLGLMPLYMSRLTSRGQAFDMDLSGGTYLSRDGHSLILLVKPARPSQDLAFDRLLIAAVRQAVEDVRAQLNSPGVAGLEVGLGGQYAQTLEEAERIRSGVKFNALFSLMAVATLYFICYRRVAALLYSTIPLLVGQALTFAVAWFAVGRLNSASAGLPALLMGLGTDFTIVMYARYVEERQHGAGLARATERMVGETGLGVFTGAITSAGTFYAMCISRFRGLYDLGLLIGTGILLCAVAIVFLLPAMITWNEGVRRRNKDVVKKLHLQSFLLEHLIPFSARHRKLVIASVTILALAGLLLALGLEFDDSMESLRSSDSQASLVQRRIAATFGASLSSMMVIAEAKTVDEAMDVAALVAERLRPFVASGTIGSFDSLATYLPPPAQQREVMAALHQGAQGPFNEERIRHAFARGLEENGFRREAYASYIERLPALLSPERPVTADDLARAGLDPLVGRYMRVEEGRVRIVTYAFSTDPRWKRRPPPGLVEAVTAGDPRILVTGQNIVGRELRRIFSVDAARSVVLGLAIIVVLLWFDFRSLRLTAIAMAQLLAGVAMMLGLMRLLDIEVNYVNAFVATMILGVGIDYGIHLVHRMELCGGRVEPGLLQTGKAVVLAAFTNVAGFGTLALGGYPALRSFGLVALIGSLTCLVTTLTLVPALMARNPDDAGPAVT